jgi:uncharacterized damage-inducible protein DinB
MKENGIQRLMREKQEANNLLIRAYKAAYREGYEDGETLEEVRDAINSHLANVIPHWMDEQVRRLNQEER